MIHELLPEAPPAPPAAPTPAQSTSAQAEPRRFHTWNGRPALKLPGDGTTLSAFADDIGHLLAGQSIFSRAGTAFIVGANGRGLTLAKKHFLRTWAEKHVTCFTERKSQKGDVIQLASTMSADAAEAVLAAPQFLDHLRPLERLNPCRMPAFRLNGDIELLPTGYDSESATYTIDDPGARFDESMTPAAASSLLADVFGEFPFADDGGRSRAVAVAALVSTFCVSMFDRYDTRAGICYVANSEGSGKTTLAKIAALPAGMVPVEAAPRTEEEWQKKLLGLVMSGRRVMLLDNLKGTLKSESLEAYMTSPQFAGRMLGKNDEFVGDAGATVLITGNGLTTGPDMRRRVIFCELFSDLLRPEDRKFTRPLDGPAIANLRPHILAACWALVRDWDYNGRPPGSRSSASFAKWAEIIGGIVENAGFANPVEPPEITSAGDTDAQDIAKMADLLDVGDMRDFSDIVELCANNGLFEAIMTRAEDFTLPRDAKAEFALTLKRFNGRIIMPGIRWVLEGAGRNRRFGLRAA